MEITSIMPNGNKMPAPEHSTKYLFLVVMLNRFYLAPNLASLSHRMVQKSPSSDAIERKGSINWSLPLQMVLASE